MISLSADDLEFGNEVAAFARDNLPAMLRRKVASELRPDKSELVAWQRLLYDKGWAAPAWPKGFGGTGWSLAKQYVFKREMGRALAPDPVPFGLQMIGPVLYKFGSTEQKARYLPSILTGETWWCQGFSEPEAGSDLASLKTRARDDGDAFVVSGQKIWTSLAQWADMMFCLVRSEDGVKPQAGISMLMIDMRSPGVTVRPIITLDGHHHLNEVFLDDVRVPTSNLVGERGQGWTYARYLLGHERVGIANIPRLRRRIDALKQISSAATKIDLSSLREISAFEVDLIALEQAELRTLARMVQQRPGLADASILKVISTELLQRSDGLLARLLGPDAAIMPTSQERLASDAGALHWGVMPALLHGRASTIYGGSTEIQRNIIAREALKHHAN